MYALESCKLLTSCSATDLEVEAAEELVVDVAVDDESCSATNAEEATKEFCYVAYAEVSEHIDTG